MLLSSKFPNKEENGFRESHNLRGLCLKAQSFDGELAVENLEKVALARSSAEKRRVRSYFPFFAEVGGW